MGFYFYCWVKSRHRQHNTKTQSFQKSHLFIFGLFKMGTCYVAQAELESMILLPQPPESGITDVYGHPGSENIFFQVIYPMIWWDKPQINCSIKYIKLDNIWLIYLQNPIYKIKKIRTTSKAITKQGVDPESWVLSWSMAGCHGHLCTWGFSRRTYRAQHVSVFMDNL